MGLGLGVVTNYTIFVNYFDSEIRGFIFPSSFVPFRGKRR